MPLPASRIPGPVYAEAPNRVPSLPPTAVTVAGTSEERADGRGSLARTSNESWSTRSTRRGLPGRQRNAGEDLLEAGPAVADGQVEAAPSAERVDPGGQPSSPGAGTGRLQDQPVSAASPGERGHIVGGGPVGPDHDRLTATLVEEILHRMAQVALGPETTEDTSRTRGRRRSGVGSSTGPRAARPTKAVMAVSTPMMTGGITTSSMWTPGWPTIGRTLRSSPARVGSGRIMSSDVIGRRMMTIPLGRFGFWQMLRNTTPEMAREVETLGYGAIWVGGSPAGDLVEVEALLDATERIPVVTGIVNMWREEAETVAASYHRVAGNHPDRFLLGVGIGHREATQEYRNPLAKIGDYLDRLDSAGVPRDRMVLAALGPKALRIAAERTAGAHPYLTTPAHTGFAREVMGEGVLLAPEHKVVLDEDADDGPGHRAEDGLQLPGTGQLPEQSAPQRMGGSGPGQRWQRRPGRCPGAPRHAG